jgi:hypothetical protein
MNYPKAIKAFYVRFNDDGRTVAVMDVLAAGIGKIIAEWLVTAPYFGNSGPGWAGSARPVIIRRRVVSRRVIGRRRVIGSPVIAVVVGRRRERHEWCCDDRRGGADDGTATQNGQNNGNGEQGG